VRKPAALAPFRIAVQALYRLRGRPVTAVQRVYALEQRLAALEAGGDNVLVQYLLEQVMHWHFVAMISRKICRKRAQGGLGVDDHRCLRGNRYPNPGCKRLQILAEFLQIFLVFACIRL